MLFLMRNGLAILRWLIHAGMLMLIMLLLFMDTPERRPFVQSLVLGVVAEVQSKWDEDGWTEFAAAQGRAAQVESAVRLSRHLPQEWWTVDGELINELDLAAVLCHRPQR
jgi:hypothetical protein